jgi:hypothetical protein
MVRQEALQPIIFTEKAQVVQMIKIFEEAGYLYEEKTTHEDNKGNIHFLRNFSPRPYPRFHLICDLNEEKFRVHLDHRQHKSQDFSPYLSEELERLYSHFTEKLRVANGATQNLISLLARQALTYAFFNSSDEINNPKKRVKPKLGLEKTTKDYKLRRGLKHRYLDRGRYVIYGGVIEDWEPLSETISKHERSQSDSSRQ